MIKLVCDSSCGITKEFADKHDIKIVSLKTTLGDVTKLEGFENEWDEFYDAVKATKEFPKTSQPSPDSFIEVVEDVLNKNAGAQVLVVTLSATLSGTFNAARIAVDTMNNENVAVLDSGCCSAGTLLIVEDLLKFMNEKTTLKEVLAYAESIKDNYVIQFVPETIEYLKRGGRIGLVSATFASILKIKPLMHFKNGVLKCPKKFMGISRAMQEQIEYVGKVIEKLYVVYVHESEYLSTFVSKVKEFFGLNNVQIHKIGPVVGSHAGPGAFGLAYKLKA